MAMTKKSKILVSIIFVLGGATWAGILFDVLAHDGFAKILLVASVIVAVALVRLYISAKTEIQKGSGAQKSKPNYIAVIVATVFTFGYVYLSVIKGVPAALHALTSKEGSLVVTVDFKPSRYKNSKCPGGVYLKGYNYFLNNKICGIRKEAWCALRPGDSLILFGSKSLFGFRYSQYKILAASEN